jgi:RNA polymerase sigma-70 factor (ECF subfamily)
MIVSFQKDHLELVQQAMNGRTEALHQLAETVCKPLKSYVLRITFKEEITDDIVQETLLEMYKIFAQLKNAELFWPWLCKIALNKVRQYSLIQKRHHELLKNHADQTGPKSPNLDGLAAAINQEFQRVIVQSLSYLSDQQRAVLSMRCYENMHYSEIAEVLDTSEIACRIIFVRARKKLQQKLNSFGYGQKSILLALALLGKLTAPSEAAAAQICLSPSILSAGSLAATIAFITGKTALITVAAGGIAVAGAVSLRQEPVLPAGDPIQSTPYSLVQDQHSMPEKSHLNEGFFFFPQGRQGAVLTRLAVHREDAVTQVLQNDIGNYTYDAKTQRAIIHNHRYWHPDLSVMTLPTDSPDLEAFLAQVENRLPNLKPIKSDSPNLFIMIDGHNQQPVAFGAKNYDALMEERFQYNWPSYTGLLDKRDSLHQQGWCRVKISGLFGKKPVTGFGELPFTYSKLSERPAWLKLTLDKQTFIDTPSGAAILNADGTLVSKYPSGTFLCGLSRPWSGLHSIDTARRDAAQFHISFKTALDSDGQRGLVCLETSDRRINYEINMDKDLIEKIIFTDLEGIPVGFLSFDYLEASRDSDTQFEMMRLPSDVSSSVSQPIHWLSMLLPESFKAE